MSNNSNSKILFRLTLTMALVIVAGLGIGCMGMKKPWRDYSQKEFNSAEWLGGDRIERGRMVFDLDEKKAVAGKSESEVLAILGEPDKKKPFEGKDVWFYKTDVGIMGALDNVPISFDPKRGAYVGLVRGTKISLGVKDEDLK